MDSPFAQHLHTNYAPSDLEVKAIRSHLIPHSQEVLRLGALISELSAQRNKTMDYIDAHKALISPVRRLPPDIVQEIFLACLPTHRNCVLSANEAPLILSRICSAWRTFALSTPALWASLHLPLEYIFEWSLTNPVTEWLARTGRHPLSLSILGPRDLERWDSEGDEVDVLLDALVRCADRWSTLDLSFDSYEGLLRLSDVCAPALHTIKTKCDPVELAQLKLLTTPSLRVVTICLWQDFDRYVHALPLRWEHLTSISFDSMGLHQMQGLSLHVALDVLKRCPRLEHFETDVNNDFEFAPPSPLAVQPHVVLPALQTLIISRKSSSMGPMTLEFLIGHLIMPRLRHLQLPRTNQAQFALPFLGDLSTTSPLIEELDIDLTGLAYESLLQNIRMLPSLRKLVVLDSDAIQNVGPKYIAATVHLLLESLAPPSDVESTAAATPLCPQLCELWIRECRDLPGWEVELLDFAQRRLHSCGDSFKHLDIEYKMFMPPIAPDVLAAFSARGLSISSSCPTHTWSHSPQPDTPWTGVDP